MYERIMAGPANLKTALQAENFSHYIQWNLTNVPLHSQYWCIAVLQTMPSVHSDSAEKTVDVNVTIKGIQVERNLHIRNKTNFGGQEKGDVRTDLCMPVLIAW